MTGVVAVVLAAGGSRRLGEPKQLLRLAGQPLVRRAALAALESRARDVVVVTGAHGEAVERALAGLALECVRCADWQSGLAASLRAGVAAALARDPEASVLVLLADQPALTPALIDALIARHAAGAELAASLYGSEPGVPAVFAPRFARELLASEGDRGAKGLLRAHAGVALVPFPGGELDVDTPEDWARISRILEPRTWAEPR